MQFLHVSDDGVDVVIDCQRQTRCVPRDQPIHDRLMLLLRAPRVVRHALEQKPAHAIEVALDTLQHPPHVRAPGERME